MDLRRGFTLDQPAVTIPWDSTDADVRLLIGPALRRVTAWYWTAPVESLGGLRCKLGFHFDRERGLLEELEFFRSSYTNQKESFDEFQRYFERAFGTPTETATGTEGFPSYRWIVHEIEIRHFVFERFGPEEHMRVRRLFGS